MARTRIADPARGTPFGKLRVEADGSWYESGTRVIPTLCNCAPGILRPYIAPFYALIHGKITACGECIRAAALSARRARGMRMFTRA